MGFRYPLPPPPRPLAMHSCASIGAMTPCLHTQYQYKDDTGNTVQISRGKVKDAKRQFAHQVQLRLCLPCNPNISVKVRPTRHIPLHPSPFDAWISRASGWECEKWLAHLGLPIPCFSHSTCCGGLKPRHQPLDAVAESPAINHSKVTDPLPRQVFKTGRLQIAGCKDEGTCNKIVRHVINCLNTIQVPSESCHTLSLLPLPPPGASRPRLISPGPGSGASGETPREACV